MTQIDFNKRTIIYIFGPKRFAKQYNSNNEKLSKDNGGWLKIGQTDADISIDKWDASMKRIIGEVRTGIPETCRLYDTFEFPSTGEKIDDIIRHILTSDMYELENSMANNKLINDPREIRAGQEFIYNASRNNILNAVAKYERNLIIKYKDDEEILHFVIKLIEQNSNIEDYLDDENPVDEETSIDEIQNADEKPWIPIFKYIEDNLPTPLVKKLHFHKAKPNGLRPYAHITTGYVEKGKIGFCYSIQKNEVSVSFIVNGGDSSKDKVQDRLKDNQSPFAQSLAPQQGTKNYDKWDFKTTLSLDNVDIDEVNKWLIDNIKQMDELFSER